MTCTTASTLTHLFGIAGKVATITGAGAGIGREIATTLARLGARVVLADRDLRAAQETAQSIVQSGGEALALPLEVDQEDSVVMLFAQIQAHFSRVDILVNGAGVFPETPLLSTSASQWEAVQRVNALGTFLCLREAAKLMKERGEGGRIINISSIGSLRSSATGRSAYNSSKACVNRLTTEAAQELAPLGILVNAVLPGPIATEKLDQLDITHPHIRKAVLRQIPVGRWGTPQDIAAAVVFLSSTAGSFITGQTLAVDGGALLV